MCPVFLRVSLLLSSVNFYSDHVRLSPVFLNLWTPPTPISFYFLFRVKLFIFVLALFPYCLFCDLTPSIILNFFCSFNLSFTSCPHWFYIYSDCSQKKKWKINQSLSLSLRPSPAIVLSPALPSQTTRKNHVSFLFPISYLPLYHPVCITTAFMKLLSLRP